MTPAEAVAKLRSDETLRTAVETLRRFTDMAQFWGDDPPPFTEAAKIVLKFVDDLAAAADPAPTARGETAFDRYIRENFIEGKQ